MDYDRIIRETIQELAHIEEPNEKLRTIQYLKKLLEKDLKKETFKSAFAALTEETKNAERDIVKSECIKGLFGIVSHVKDANTLVAGLKTILETGETFKSKAEKENIYENYGHIISYLFDEMLSLSERDWKEIFMHAVIIIDPESDMKASQAEIVHLFRQNKDDDIFCARMTQKEKKLIRLKMESYYDRMRNDVTKKMTKDSYYDLQIAADLACFIYT